MWLSLLILCFIHVGHGYNLVVDTQFKGIQQFIRSFREIYENELENYEIPSKAYKRRLGNVELTKIIVSKVLLESVDVAISQQDYYLNIQHLQASLHGDYKHNVLFIEQKGDFRLDIVDLNATIGPLIPVNIGGLPYLHPDISCSISHCEDHVEVHGGILKCIMKRRLSETLKEDLENILCDSLVGILDRSIRTAISNLQLVIPLRNDSSITYLLSRLPLVLPSSSIRTYHLGVTSISHSTSQYEPTTIESNHDVIYHLHEGLFTEVVQSLCEDGFMDGIFSLDKEKLRLTCLRANITLRNMFSSKTANLMIDYKQFLGNSSSVTITKNYALEALHSEHLIISFRIKSEISHYYGRSISHFNDQIFSFLSSVIRSLARLPLPFPKGARAKKSQIALLNDRVIFATNVSF